MPGQGCSSLTLELGQPVRPPPEGTEKVHRLIVRWLRFLSLLVTVVSVLVGTFRVLTPRRVNCLRMLSCRYRSLEVAKVLPRLGV